MYCTNSAGCVNVGDKSMTCLRQTYDRAYVHLPALKYKRNEVQGSSSR